MNKPIYVNGIHSISPQASFNNLFFDSAVEPTPRKYFQIIAPKYRDYIPAKQLRRMAKQMKLGLIGAQKAIEDANSNSINAIIVGTGNGNISDTQKFLNSIIDNKERMLIPTSFVQSTNNIVAGSIALMLKNKQYNTTYTHHGAAFEISLIDAIMLFAEDKAKTILVGGIDEITEETFEHKSQGDLWTKEALNPFTIKENNYIQGAIMGESSSFFILSSQRTEHSYAQLLDVKVIHTSFESLDEILLDFLLQNNISRSQINLLIAGFNGVESYDKPQQKFLQNHFKNTPIAFYKHYVGEHPSASAFGFWMANQILSSKKIDENIWYTKQSIELNDIEYVLLFQQAYLSEKDFALILLKKA